MSKTNTSDKVIDIDPAPKTTDQDKPKTCFVIMPISDQPGYETGHFTRVYHELIKPAIEKAGFVAERADTANQTHNIILSILKSIVDSDMAICDVSSLNPNVMYELGIRQMAKKPVVLIKDAETRDIFDITILKYIKYQSRLRVDEVRESIEEISVALRNTYNNEENRSNSLLDLLNIEVQVEKKSIQISSGEQLILARLERIEASPKPNAQRTASGLEFANSGNYKTPTYGPPLAAWRLSPGDFCEFIDSEINPSQKALVFIGTKATDLVFIDIITMQKLIYEPKFTPYKFTARPLTAADFNFFTETAKVNIRSIEGQYPFSIVH